MSLDPSLVIAAAGTAIGAIGIILAVFTYFRPRRVKAVAFDIETRNLIKEYSPKLMTDFMISYKGKRVNLLSETRIALWNEGTETIDGSNITTLKPLSICVGNGAQLLEARIVLATAPENEFTLVSKDDCALLNFNYIDHFQGAIIQVLHTGTSSKNVDVAGVIKGAKPIRRRRLVIAPHVSLWERARSAFAGTLLFSALLAGLAGALLLLGIVEGTYRLNPSAWTAESIAATLEGLIEVGVGLFMLLFVAELYQHWRSFRFPKGFDTFREDIE